MDNIPCKYLERWVENQSPLGSGEYWPMNMEECNHPSSESERNEQQPEEYDKCDERCPGYEPMEVATCPKHGEFVKEYGCDGCLADEYEMMKREV